MRTSLKRFFRNSKIPAPKGLRYASIKLDDGLSFVRIASIETQDGSNPPGESRAFKNFQANIADRCENPPVAVDIHEIGFYNLLGD